jgi:hypothetical protein
MTDHILFELRERELPEGYIGREGVFVKEVFREEKPWDLGECPAEFSLSSCDTHGVKVPHLTGFNEGGYASIDFCLLCCREFLANRPDLVTPEVVTIDVARNFSQTPGARYQTEGLYSGEEFREKVVEPLLEEGKRVIVDLDGPPGMLNSFIEEVFGGLVRKFGSAVTRQVLPRANQKVERLEKAKKAYETMGKKSQAPCCHR